MPERLLNYINGTWHKPAAAESLRVLNPASAAVLAEVPLSPAVEVDLRRERRRPRPLQVGAARPSASASSRCSS